MRKYIVKWTRPYQMERGSSDYDKLRDAWKKADEVSVELPLERISVFRNSVTIRNRIKRNGAKYYY